MTQTVAVTSQAAAPHVLIAAESGGSVFIWEKTPVQEPSIEEQNSRKPKEPTHINSNGNWKVIILVIILTYSSWSPYLFAVRIDFSTIYVSY